MQKSKEQELDRNGLEKQCLEVRRLIVKSVYEAGSGHPGGSLSGVELLTTLFENFLKFDPKNPKSDSRDYFVLSKGHCAPLLYSIMAFKGYFPVEELKTLRKLGSRLQGHPDALKLPGIEVSTGSLGQGFGVAAGIALSLKIDKKVNKVYALLGDGELQEGTVWETAMAASHFKLDNFCAVIDSNKFQIDGSVETVMGVEPIKQKFESFGWECVQINGHDLKQVDEAYQAFLSHKSGKPFLIVADTLKGKGVSFMENTEKFHGKAPSPEEFEKAMIELGEKAL